jgi:ubiquinone/menaquinone biosynthesis C-methylase UbiE
MTNSYGRFAEVYDALMTDIPYDAYVAWVMEHAPAASNKKLLDIGCGTGVMAVSFAKAGYDVSGLDLSEEMLMVASERCYEEDVNVFFVCQSMDELNGFDNLDVVTIPIDSLNYVPEQSAVQETLNRIYASLKQGGHLFFDIHSLFKMDEIFMDSPFTYDDGDITYLWDTEAGEAPHSVHHDMVFYVVTEDGLYERFEEQHYQRTYSIEEMLSMLQQAGFTDIEVTADFTDEAPTLDSERIFFHCVK